MYASLTVYCHELRNNMIDDDIELSVVIDTELLSLPYKAFTISIIRNYPLVYISWGILK